MPLPLKKSNTTKLRIRAHVEHVFAVQKEQMNLFVRTIGLKRAKVKIGLANITCNIKRLIFFEKRKEQDNCVHILRIDPLSSLFLFRERQKIHSSPPFYEKIPKINLEAKKLGFLEVLSLSGRKERQSSLFAKTSNPFVLC